MGWRPIWLADSKATAGQQNSNTITARLAIAVIPSSNSAIPDNNAVIPGLTLDLTLLCYFFWYAFFLFNSTEAATKRDVLIGLGLALFFTIQAMNLFDDLVQWARRYKELSRELDEKLPILGRLEK